MSGILIVDDHAGFRGQARALLEEAGYQVTGEAADAEGAVRTARDTCPDVVLLDVQLPDHDGFWVADELQALCSVPQIVFISSRLASDYGTRLLERSASFILKADLSRQRLTDIIGRPSAT